VWSAKLPASRLLSSVGLKTVVGQHFKTIFLALILDLLLQFLKIRPCMIALIKSKGFIYNLLGSHFQIITCNWRKIGFFNKNFGKMLPARVFLTNLEIWTKQILEKSFSFNSSYHAWSYLKNWSRRSQLNVTIFQHWSLWRFRCLSLSEKYLLYTLN